VLLCLCQKKLRREWRNTVATTQVGMQVDIITLIIRTTLVQQHAELLVAITMVVVEEEMVVMLERKSQFEHFTF
jgi:hypothetical protein